MPKMGGKQKDDILLSDGKILTKINFIVKWVSSRKHVSFKDNVRGSIMVQMTKPKGVFENI